MASVWIIEARSRRNPEGGWQPCGEVCDERAEAEEHMREAAERSGPRLMLHFVEYRVAEYVRREVETEPDGHAAATTGTPRPVRSRASDQRKGNHE